MAERRVHRHDDGQVIRYTISNNGHVPEGEELTGEARDQMLKTWKEQQEIDLSIWGGVSDKDLLKMLKGKL